LFFDLSSRRAVYFTGYTERETGEHHVLAYSAATATCYAEGDSSCSRSRSGDLRPHACSFLAHATDINDLLEGLDGVLKDGLDGLHDTESSFHIVDLWLHALDGLHLSGDLNEWLSVIESLEDSSGKGLLDVLGERVVWHLNLTFGSSRIVGLAYPDLPTNNQHSTLKFKLSNKSALQIMQQLYLRMNHYR
jgi:hypothetical protein